MTSIIADLKDPDVLPDKTGGVSVVQTHISIVFVADDFVYKVKKPVDFGFLDFSTLAKRYHFSHEELRLNRRFAPDLYLAVVAIGVVWSWMVFGRDPIPVTPPAGSVLTRAARRDLYGDTFNATERLGWAPIFFTASRPESRGLVVLENRSD